MAGRNTLRKAIDVCREVLHERWPEMKIEEPLLSYLLPLRFKKILDVGCGYGRITSYLKIIWPGAEVIALDVSRKSTL